MKITIQYGEDSGVNPPVFEAALEEWALDWLDIDEELDIVVGKDIANGLPD